VCPICLLDEPLPSVMLGDSLELHDLLGEGAMGSVFRATDHKLKREVAVKLLPKGQTESRELAERLKRESRALATLNHPGIITIHDCGDIDGQPYLVMSLVDGPSLRAEGRLSSYRVKQLGQQVCDALQYAHERGIVHRDIKPENILLRPDGSAVLADFGIARSALQGSDWTITAEHHAAGSPHYMAPEAFKGAAPDPRMDIYGLAVVLYELLTGELPQGAFARLDQPWDTVIRRALATDPNQRFADAAAFGRALSALPTEGDAGASSSVELPVDEHVFLRALAALQTLASAAVIWAIYLSILPQAIVAADVEPLMMLPGPPMADGRVIILARFVPSAVLAALFVTAVALLGYGLLRRHWRREGLERYRPNAPVRTSRWVLALGVFNVVGFSVRLLLDQLSFDRLTAFVPILGGISEAVTIYLCWLTFLGLELNRRPVLREWRLWLGLVLSAVPPLVELTRYLSTWAPTP
jgi:serine/threonine protein kinase